MSTYPSWPCLPQRRMALTHGKCCPGRLDWGLSYDIKCQENTRSTVRQSTEWLATLITLRTPSPELSLPQKPSVEVGQEEGRCRPAMETSTEVLAVPWGQGHVEVSAICLSGRSYSADSADLKQGSFRARMEFYQSCLYPIVFHVTFSRHTKKMWLN